MLEYNSEYHMLICPIHKYAVHDPDIHLRYHHCITGREKDALLDQWKWLDLISPLSFHRPLSGRRPKDFLDQPVLGYSCSSCFFLTVKWEAVLQHYAIVHDRGRAVKRPRRNKPSPDVKLVYLQTFFPFPHIRWFTVGDENDGGSHQDRAIQDNNEIVDRIVTDPADDATARDSAEKGLEDFSLAGRIAIQDRYLDVFKLREQQRSQAPKLREVNAASLFLDRLPLEVRQEIYKSVLGSGTVFHIVDEDAVVKPNLSYGMETDDHDLIGDDGIIIREEVELREDWEDTLEDTVDAHYEASEKTRLRAVSIPKSNPHTLAILKVCSHFNEEATSIFYGSNQFRLHSGTANFSTALQFLSLLSPATRNCITSFGVAGLQPCLKLGPGRYGTSWRTSEFNRKCRLYYQSEKRFFAEALPQLALKELDLGFDLSHLAESYLEEDGNFQMEEHSPKAPWLNKFLRLPLKRINLNFGRSVLRPRHEETANYPVVVLIDACNHVDGQTRIRAKNEWDDHFKPNDTHEALNLE